MKKALILFLLFTLCSPLLRAEVNYPITPESIQKQVEQRGLGDVHDEIFSHPFAVNMLLLAIDSAEADWLDIAELFLQEQNPISGPRLIMAIGEGLQWNPAAIFKRDMPLIRICSIPGLYEWRQFSLFLAERSIQRRLRALDSVSKTNEKAQKCRQLLLKTQKTLPNTFTNSLPEHHH